MNIAQASLRFEPDSRRWFVQSAEGVWSLNRSSDATALATYLELQIADSGKRPALQGKAGLRPGRVTDHELVLQSLQDADDQLVMPLHPATVSTAAMEWTFGLYRDKWLDCDSELVLTETTRAGFCFYLPERPGTLEKTLSILADGHAIAEVQVHRGVPVELWVDIPPQLQAHCRLTLQASYEEPIFLSADGRSLGVILVRMNLDNTAWKDVAAA